ncbi:MAG: DUF4252 domain-containing protein [Bacteroidota bacterium]
MKLLKILPLLLLPLFTQAQSKVMRNLSEQYPDAFVLMFYHSSLNMLNIDDDPTFSRMIRDLEKIKLLRINKDADSFTKENLNELKEELNDRDYEKLMVAKSKEFDITVYILEDPPGGGQASDIEGFFLFMDEESEFYAIDVVGSMNVSDIGLLVDRIKEVKGF